MMRLTKKKSVCGQICGQNVLKELLTQIRRKHNQLYVDKNTAYQADLQDMRCLFGRSEKI